MREAEEKVHKDKANRQLETKSLGEDRSRCRTEYKRPNQSFDFKLRKQIKDMARSLTKMEGSRGHERSPPGRTEFKRRHGYDPKKSCSGGPTCYKCFEKGHIMSVYPKK